MLLTDKNIKKELEIKYPSIVFNAKYKKEYIKYILFLLNANLMKKIKGKTEIEIMDITNRFLFNVERKTEDLNSIYKISDELFEEIKNDLLYTINPNYIKEKKSKKLTEHEAISLIELHLTIERKNYLYNLHYIFPYYRNNKLLNNKKTRDLLYKKNQLVDFNREKLFHKIHDRNLKDYHRPIKYFLIRKYADFYYKQKICPSIKTLMAVKICKKVSSLVNISNIKETEKYFYFSCTTNEENEENEEIKIKKNKINMDVLQSTIMDSKERMTRVEKLKNDFLNIEI